MYLSNLFVHNLKRLTQFYSIMINEHGPAPMQRTFNFIVLIDFVIKIEISNLNDNKF